MIEPNPGFLSQLRSYEDQLKSRFLADSEEPLNPTSLLV